MAKKAPAPSKPPARPPAPAPRPVIPQGGGGPPAPNQPK